MRTYKNNNTRITNINYEKIKISRVLLMPLLLIAGLVPLITYAKYIDLTGSMQSFYWTGQNIYLDFFSYWKSRWFIFMVITALVIYLILYFLKKLPFKKEYRYYIPLCIYTFFVLLSTIFAVDTKTALSGFVDLYQGIWVLFSYALLTFLTINYVNGERDIKLFLHIFIFLIAIEGIIGVGQYFGFDIFNSKIGNYLILPGDIKVNGGLSFKFGEHTIYGTLFNTNFVGSFTTLMLPMAAAFLVSAKNIKNRIFASVVMLLCTFIWIGCNSRAGYVGVVVIVLLSLLLFRKYVFKHWKISLSVFAVGIISLFVLNTISDGKVVNQISRLNIFKEMNEIKLANESIDKHIVDNIEVGQDYVTISSNLQDIKIKVKDKQLLFSDENGNDLSYSKDESGALIISSNSSENYYKIAASEGYPGFNVDMLKIPNGTLRFFIGEDEIKVINSGGRLSLPDNPSTFKAFDGIETFASNRGYIWGRTIPLMTKYAFIGAGPDNFAYVFPQDDYVGKINAYQQSYIVVDKPHNMYLQIAINTGLISLLSLLTLWGIYIVSSLKLYWNMNYDSIDKLVGVACMLGVIGYLVAGIFNDQIVSVAPLFWMILGIGISVNSRLKSKLNPIK